MEFLLESFKYGLAPSLIILVYLVFARYFDHRREIKKLEKEEEEAKKTIKINAEIIDCFNELNTYLKRITKDILDVEDDKCTNAIHSSFKSMGYTVSKFATFTILKNNVETNKENIIDNIENIITAEFTSIYNNLALFNTKNIAVSTFIKESWPEEIKSDLISNIFNKHSSKEDRIYDIQNKLNIRINAYINSVTKQYSLK